MLKLEGARLDYCGQCHRPAWVGSLTLAGWLHKFTICSTCLEKLAADITALQTPPGGGK